MIAILSDLKTTNLVRLLAWYNRYKRHKAFKTIHKELLPLAWHPTKAWDWCILQVEKNKYNQS